MKRVRCGVTHLQPVSCVVATFACLRIHRVRRNFDNGAIGVVVLVASGADAGCGRARVARGAGRWVGMTRRTGCSGVFTRKRPVGVIETSVWKRWRPAFFGMAIGAGRWKSARVYRIGCRIVFDLVTVVTLPAFGVNAALLVRA